MARKARQRISYVLPLANSAGGHRLGVNGLAIDGDSNTLYSGGRDGVICAWDLNLDLYNPPRAASPSEKPPPLPATTFRRQVQAHTHWINDIILTHANQALVSASSDISVKIWRPTAHDSLPPQTIGLHNDYVKVLACPDQHTNWVASGGLDRKIFLWDTNGAGQRLSIDVGLEEGASGLGRDKGSVYALDATHSLVGSGGPESAVRMWDPRSGKRITKFVGHTDNVRDILISDDSSTVMTASSDQTVKVWSVTAGRCMNTFTMHDDSVWSLWSDHPQLSIFYSSDRSGMIAKTDTRGCAELEEGLSVAICQEHQSVHKVVAAGDYIWTATSRPSINRWKDVDTDGAEVEMPEGIKQQNHRHSIATIRSRMPSVTSPGNGPQSPTRDSPSGENKIPLKHVLRLSNTAYIPHMPRPSTREGTAEGEPAETEEIQPMRNAPESHIQGQNGLIKHVMLSDRRRVLTLDTAGEVMMWDLIKCEPIKSFGKRHIEDVTPEVNTVESVPNWCTVDTRTGSLAITLEENNAFDAEMYADELDLVNGIDFKEDQRINLGKWVLRYLFANLIDEEIRRDQQIRRYLLNNAKQQKLERENAPTSIQMPPNHSTNGWHDSSAPPTASTMKAVNGNSLFTPGMSIGQATPGIFGGGSVKAKDGNGTRASEDGAPLSKTISQRSVQGRASIENKDYFSTATSGTEGITSPTETVKVPMTPSGENPTEEGDSATALPGDTPSKFGRKFGMKMSFNMKKLTRTNTNDTAKAAAIDEAPKEEVDADSRSSKTSNSRIVDENFLGCIQKIRFNYEDDLIAQNQRQTAVDAAGGALGSAKDLELPSQITPSLPSETPVLKPPGNTTILIQEERPEAGGVADLWEGKLAGTGEAANVDLLEKCAPMWLGDVLLRNQIPLKDVVKISFVLEPWKGSLPAIATEGNNRLNANRMLRARKILSYVSERIEPANDLENKPTNPIQTPGPDSAPVAAPTAVSPTVQASGTVPSLASNNPYASYTSPTSTPKPDNPFASSDDEDSDSDTESHHEPQSAVSMAPSARTAPAAALRPEDYLELYCNNQLIPPTMTLASIRAHIWKSGGDVVLVYKANGRKQILHQPQTGIAGSGGINGDEATHVGTGVGAS